MARRGTVFADFVEIVCQMNQENTDSKITAGTHISCWTSTTSPRTFASLNEDIEVDVVIVGAGISGLSVAYCLAKSGLRVAVLESGLIGSGETGRTTAHIVNALDDRYYEIERIFGEEGAKLAAQSHTAAISFIEKVCAEENIRCDFRRVSGYLFRDPSDAEDSLEREFEAVKKAGIDVRWHDEVPYIKTNEKASIEFPNQAQFHPMKYLNGLATAFVKTGGRIFDRCRASEISGKGVKTEDGYMVSASHVVVATNSPVNNKFVMHLKQYPYRTYVIGAKIEKGKLPYALWWDTGDHESNSDMPPYHYIRLQELDDQYDLLISGGCDHPTGLPEAQDESETATYAKLEGWTKSRFPIEEVVYRWSGQVYEPMDALGFIGRNPMDSNNVYIVTGDSGNGMTHGTIAGILLNDMILGRENPWQKIYSPSRTNFLKSGSTFVKQFFGGLLQYMKQTRKDSGKMDLSSIANGKAEIIEIDKQKFGAYRDPQGQIHLVTTTCTHAGCTVRWNSDELSWDCPCHGSRFSHEGKVLNGPANEDLSYYNEPAEVEKGG